MARTWSRPAMSLKFLGACLLLFLWLQEAHSQGACGGVLPTLASLENVILDVATLESLEGDVQKLLDCMPDGAVLELKLPDMRLTQPLIITRSISITSRREKTVLHCPVSGSNLVDIRASNVEFSKIDIKGCNVKRKKSPIDVVDSMNVSFTSISCSDSSTTGNGGCLSSRNSSIRIDDSHFLNGSAPKGGALSITNGSTLHVESCTFGNNTAEVGGGAIFVSASDVEIIHSDFQTNVALDDGGAIFAESEEETLLKLANIEFESNSVFGVYEGTRNFRAGGAVALFGSGVSCEIVAGSFLNNTSEMDGGGVAAMHGADLHVRDSTFFENSAFQGGGIYVETPLPNVSNITILNTVFKENMATGSILSFTTMGGAISIFEHGVSARIEGCRFVGNNGGLLGGAMVALRTAFLDIIRSQFVENVANQMAGALYTESTEQKQSLVQISDSIFEANSAGRSDGDATSRGGGIVVRGKSMTFLLSGHNVFRGNWATLCGGAVFAGRGCDVSVKETFFAANEALSGDGGAVCVEVIVTMSQDAIGESTSLIMDNTTFVHNQAAFRGGGLVALGPDTKIQLHTVNFTQNEAHERGGAVATMNLHMLTAKNSTFLANTSPIGGGMFCYRIQDANYSVNVHLMTTTFEENSAASSGGAIEAVGEELNIFLDDVSFLSNRVNLGGGAIHASGGPDVVVQNSLFHSNVAFNGSGGAISAETINQVPTMINVTGTVFENNTADGELGLGGAIALEGVKCRVSNGTLFEGNGAKTFGGAVAVLLGASFVADDSSMSGNFAAKGGAMWIESAGIETAVVITDSFFKSNVAIQVGGEGGAIGMAGSQTKLSVSATTMQENSAHETGGAISATNVTRLHIGQNSVFSMNAAQVGGAVFVQAGEDTPTVVSVDYTLFERNTAVAGLELKSYGGGLELIGPGLMCSLAEGVEFFQNQAAQGGAISAVHGANLTADKIVIRENVAGNGTGGGVHFESGDFEAELSLQNSEFTSNSAHGKMSDGGAIHVYGNRVSATLSGIRFENNTADDVGGAVAAQELLDIVIEDNLFIDNHAPGGGALFATAESVPFNLTIMGGKFQDNLAEVGLGGAAYILGPVHVDIGKGALLMGNRALHGGGALFFRNISSAAVVDSEFNANQAGDIGGGAILTMTASNSEMIISQSTFDSNRARVPQTAGEFGNGGALNVIGLGRGIISGVFLNNSAGNGGAIATGNGTQLVITASNFEENAADRGGALFVRGGPQLHDRVTIESTSFVNNSAVVTEESRGGAIALVGLETPVTSSVVCDIHSQCAFINNTAAFGGAISVEEATVLMDQTNLIENSGGHGGAVWVQAFSQASLHVQNTNFTYNMGTVSDGFCGAVDTKGTNLTATISSDTVFATRFSTTEWTADSANNFLENVTCIAPSGN